MQTHVQSLFNFSGSVTFYAKLKVTRLEDIDGGVVRTPSGI